MQSLRTRRSQAPARKPTRQPTNGKLSKDARPRPRDSGKSRVDDKIKKRMSTRYADISSPTELNVPPMPTLSDPISGDRRGGGDLDEFSRDREDLVSQKAADAAAEEKKLLDTKDFDPDVYLKKKLANSTEAELKSLQSSLRSSKDDTASELQRSVFKNYAEFVMISKEISTLENEMLELKESLSEYKSMPSMLHIPDPTSASSSNLSTYRRSSVADLRIMYFNQMQQLHAQIEGSAKFAPTTPGRHVVGEADGVLALNAATYKVMGRVKFVVLDDAVLVAKRRRRTAGGGDARRGASLSEGKLVAERCWSLNEMVVLDSKDSPSMTNVFKVRHGKETHVFRTEIPAEKKTLMGMLRQVGDDYNAKRRKEREGEHERRKSMWPGADQGSSAPPDWMAEFAKLSSTTADAKEKSERDIRWTGEWADELTVAIALRQWDRAVELAEEGKKKLSTTPPLAVKLPLLTTQLTTAILENLSHTSNRKSIVVSLINFLVRLNAGPAARSTFLTMRSQVMRSHVRKIRFEGHVGAYVADLAMVYFTGIKHTADWFLASFKENEVASAFIDWARSQVESYAAIFRNQVYSSGVEGKVVEEALKITYDLSKKLLEEYGLDFRFLLDEQLAENPKIQPKAVSSDISVESLKGPLLSRLSNSASTPKLSVTTSGTRKIPAALNIPSPSTHAGASNTSVVGTGTNGLSAALSTGSAYPETAMLKSAALRPSSPLVPGARSRTPTDNGTLPIPSSFVPPNSAPVQSNQPVPSSPIPRRMRTPPPSSTGRDRPARSARGPGSPAPPPRSSNRPGSAVSRTPVAVAQREGMI